MRNKEEKDMSLPYTAEMMESIKKVEAGRAARIGFEPRRMTADEKTALLQAFHPDYNLDSFEEIKASCKCNHKTIFNARVDCNKNIVTNGEQIEIGGDNRYTSICRKCYFEKTNHPLYQKNKNNLD